MTKPFLKQVVPSHIELSLTAPLLEYATDSEPEGRPATTAAAGAVLREACQSQTAQRHDIDTVLV